MYVETMNSEEKVKEFFKAFDKIHEVSERILDRYLAKRKTVKMKNDELYDFGMHKLTVNNTVYYYYLSVIRSSNLHQSKYSGSLSYFVGVYTIQTHKGSSKKYIIMFNPTVGAIDTITEIEIHLISRYRERFLKNSELSLDYSIQSYMKENFTGAVRDLDNNEVVKVTKDGVALGIRVDKNIIKLKTFITEEQLRVDQMLWSKYGKLWSDYIETLKYCIDHPKKLLSKIIKED